MPLSEPVIIVARRVGAQGGTNHSRHLTLRSSSPATMALSDTEGMSVTIGVSVGLIDHADLAGRGWTGASHGPGTVGSTYTHVAGWDGSTPVTVPKGQVGGWDLYERLTTSIGVTSYSLTNTVSALPEDHFVTLGGVVLAYGSDADYTISGRDLVLTFTPELATWVTVRGVSV